ncbi:two-component regulator propeller domain-containing protein [Sinomicrobium sp. M5D2P17]
MKQFYIFFILIGIVNGLYGQDYYFRNYQVEDGLSHNTITASLQDHKGFVWFGTKDGLNRFNGYDFKVFRHDPKDSTSLGNSFISVLHEYEKNIWIGTNDGLYLYSEEKEDFLQVEGTTGKAIHDITNDEHGNIWYIASGKLCRINGITLQHPDIYDLADCVNVIKSPDGSIWISTSKQLFRYIPSNDSFEKANTGDITKDPGFRILKLYAPDASSVLIGTIRHGAFRYDLQTGEMHNYFRDMQKPQFIRDILSTGTEIWFATESGIYIYDKQNGRFTNLRKNYSDFYSLSDNAVYCFTRDSEGGIWAGTYFGGINYRPREFSPFKKYFPKKGENSINGNAIREIHQDKNGVLWIGTEDAGINKLDLSTGVFESFLNKNPDGKPFNIHGILPLDNEIWVGTFQNGIQVLDIRNGDILRQYREGELISDFVRGIFQAKNGDIFILTPEGIQIYVPGEKKFKTPDYFPEGIHYTSIAEAPDGTLWAGTIMKGVFFYDPGTGEKGILRHVKDNPSSISSNFINGIFRDNDGNIWITTENGLNLLNREDHSVKRYTKEDGLPGNITYTVLEDREHRLWISTSNGLAEFDREKNSFKIYTRNNGLLHDQFNYASGYVASDGGTLYFGSVFGMVSFKPGEFTENTFRAPILFTDLKINNETVKINGKGSPLKKSVTFSENIRLTHDQKTFSLNFANLSFTAPKTTEYFYKMEGLDEDWYALGKNHAITFTQLPAGKYTLKIRSENSDGLQSETASLHIKILPPPWFSWWAYLIYTLTILLATLWIVRQYHHYSRSKSARELAVMESRKEKEVFKSKIDFFTNVAHEIRTPLSLIRAPLEKLSKSEQLNEKASYYLDIMNKNTTRLLDLVNELLDFRKAETENLKLSFTHVNISRTVREIRLQFDTAIRDKDIQLLIREPQQDIHASVDVKAFHKIVNNLFNNAVKYSDNKIVLILSQEGESLEIRLKNDGPTIPGSHAERIFEPFFRISEDGEQPGTGIGLSLAHSLAELHGGSLVYGKDEDGLNQFLLRLPIIRKGEKITVTEERGPGNTEEDTGPSAPEPAGTHLLIAEDNTELLNFIAAEFRDDYQVHKTKDGRSALEIIRDQDIQAVISDIMMPGLNGLELCKAIKTSVETSHIPVVLLTAKGALNAKIEGLENGADAYITKPFSMEHLKVQVNTLLENRKHIMQAYSSKPLAYLKNVAPSKTESDFINRLDEVIITHISDPDFNIETIADQLNMSRATLYRKIKAISDLTPNELINITRLKKAAELLVTDNYKVFEVAYMVGYRSQSSFGRNFQKQFNMPPTEYVQQVKENGK